MRVPPDSTRCIEPVTCPAAPQKVSLIAHHGIAARQRNDPVAGAAILCWFSLKGREGALRWGAFRPSGGAKIVKWIDLLFDDLDDLLGSYQEVW